MGAGTNPNGLEKCASRHDVAGLGGSAIGRSRVVPRDIGTSRATNGRALGFLCEAAKVSDRKPVRPPGGVIRVRDVGEGTQRGQSTLRGVTTISVIRALCPLLLTPSAPIFPGSLSPLPGPSGAGTIREGFLRGRIGLLEGRRA